MGDPQHLPLSIRARTAFLEMCYILNIQERSEVYKSTHARLFGQNAKYRHV